ncbi:trk system potassium uptake protein TrkH [Chitinivorax tropicus]|uniref:Trk system potassium uptake protein n=1 Tax=Chitinivorax tropicus TaxID=714531 RepID=A0A840MG34_9PROT|nr:TrkH family potassium uptake protein [Chitinivorax tropicus]MBB5017360.1 trk system potassium uptake protein TrkH [Chitinivorax tropicus]
MHKILPIANVLGKLIVLFGTLFVFPLLVSYIADDGQAADFWVAMGVVLLIGGTLWICTHRYVRELKPRDGFMLVVLLWTGFAAVATVPLMLAIEGLSFTDAYFETMSALTTTGATVLSGLDHLPASINFWRHFLNWVGGMGIIVLAVAVLPLLGVGGMQLYKAETPGPIKDSKLTPRITETAKNLWLIYAALTLLCALALKLAGMSWLDAVCHAFAALSLGGLSTHDASVGYFDSPLIEAILIVFMLLAAMNFATHFVAWRERRIRAYWRDYEAMSMLVLIGISIVVLAVYLRYWGPYAYFPNALRHVAFNLVSIATDCGFVSMDYDRWPPFAPLWMLFLSCICASSGSTGGGIKMIRTLILSRQASREMLSLLHPAVVHPVKIGPAVIPNSVVSAVLGFIFVYFMSIATLTFMLTASGMDFVSAFSAIIACINNAGPGLGQVGPAFNYQSLGDVQTWICTLAMLLGRLEVFTLLILFNPAFWRR